MPSDKTFSPENQEKRLDQPKKSGAFRSQVLPLTFFEILLGHNFSCSLKRKPGKSTSPECAKNILAFAMIAMPTIGVACFMGSTADEVIVHEIIVLLYFLTLKICISSRRKLHDLIDQIDLFDRSFSEAFAFVEAPGRDFWWGCLWVLLTLIIPVPLLLFLITQVFNIPWTSELYFFGLFFHMVASLQRSLIFVYFIAVGHAMRVRFQLIKGLLEDELQKSRPSAANLENIRIHHARLSILIDAMNASASKRLIFPILQIATEFLYIFFRYVYRDNFYVHPFILVNLLTHLITLKVIAAGSERIALESRKPLYVVRAVIISKLPFLCQAQILMFQDQVLAVPVQISAGGFFNLDNKLLTELALLIVTYCTVILQLVPNEDDKDSKESDLANSTDTN